MRLKSLDDLRRVREEVTKDVETREKAETRVIVGMGTCGIAAGARDTMNAILEELEKHNIKANVTTTGCIGMCTEEPLVDIELPDEGRVTYGNITAEKIPTLIEEHLVRNNVLREWTIGRVSGMKNEE